ncbi:MAG TPA: hypothetical protein VK249_17685 [Anaerolineales bacterium]|nr:hypothetical protein [Anaerolineales bacterium]
MFPSDLDNAAAYAAERRKDAMRYAAKRRLQREALGNRKRVSLPMAVLSGLAILLAILINHGSCVISSEVLHTPGRLASADSSLK